MTTPEPPLRRSRGSRHVTPRQLRAAAKAAWKLDAFLYRCINAGALPEMVGFDLDYLADRFWKAAQRLESQATTTQLEQGDQ